MYKIGLKVLLGWALFFPIAAYSLGLGDIDVKSFLNQPLNAEIVIISARPGEIDDLLVGLANREAFARASLSRPSHLSDLKFKVIKSDDGSSAVITVKTQTAVKEPVLNFLVEADWTKGKVFREFTILLDPPYFAQQRSTPAPAAKAVVKPNNSVFKAKPVAKQPEPIVNQVATENNPNNNESAATESYSQDVSSVDSSPFPEVQPQTSYDQGVINIEDGVTLWSVAKSLKTDNISMSQIMLALQRVNQDAFAQNNINNLKQGSVLRVPTQEDYADLSRHEAYIEVLNQNGLWNDYLGNTGQASANASNTQIDKTVASTAETTEPSRGALSIVASGEGNSDKAALRSNDDVQKISNLKKQLLLSEEAVESLKVEKDDLASRLKMLEAELEKRSQLDNLLTIQDDNLATMEQALAENELKSAIVKEEESFNEGAVVEDGTDMMTEQSEPVIEMASDEMAGSEVTGSIDSEAIIDDVIVDVASEVTVVNEGPTVIVQEPAPIIVSEVNTSSSMVDDIIQAVMSNPIVQGAIAFVLLLILLVTKFLKGRKSKQSTDEKSESIEDSFSEDPIDTQSGIIIPNVNDEDETPINVPQMEKDQPVDEFSSTLSGLQDDEDEFSKTAVISADEMSDMDIDDAADEDSDEQDETLDEVDVYLAYSLFDNAEELLKEKIAETPGRADYRAKLLDTYFATQNKEAFIDEASSLKDLGDKSSKYWARVQAMGFELDATNPMFAEGEGGDVGELAIAKPEMADFDIGAGSDDGSASSDFDLSLDGDDTNFDLSEDSNDDAALEFNLDEDLASDLKTGDDELPDNLDSLDFDLDDTPVESASTKENEENAFKGDDGIEFNADENLEFNLDDDLSADLNETVVMDVEDTAVIEADDLEFTIDEIEDDSLDISLDDIEPEIDIEEELIEEELTGTIDAITDDLIEESELLTTDAGNAVDDMEETVSFTVEDTDNDMDLDLDLNVSNEDDPLDLDLNADNEDDSLDFNITDDSDNANELDIEEISFDETVNISNLEEDTTIEKTEIISAIDVEDELVVAEDDAGTDIEDDLVIADIDTADELVIPDIENELVIPHVDINDDLIVSDDDDLDIDDITDIGNIEGLMLPDDVDEVATKLDLAKAFKDMGDAEGAKSSLEEVLADGTEEQKLEAQALLDDIAK